MSSSISIGALQIRRAGSVLDRLDRLRRCTFSVRVSARSALAQCPREYSAGARSALVRRSSGVRSASARHLLSTRFGRRPVGVGRGSVAHCRCSVGIRSTFGRRRLSARLAFGQSSVGIRSAFGRHSVGAGSANGLVGVRRHSVGVWSAFGRGSVGVRSALGRRAVGVWSAFGRHSVGIRLACGRR